MPRAGGVAVREALTCLLSDRIDEVRERLAASDWEHCVVLDPGNIVHGRVDVTTLTEELDPDATIESVMQAGPATVRPSEDLAGLVDRMREHDVDTMIVTTSDGRFVGVLRRSDAEHALSADENIGA